VTEDDRYFAPHPPIQDLAISILAHLDAFALQNSATRPEKSIIGIAKRALSEFRVLSPF
jgi:hypothetical protein